MEDVETVAEWGERWLRGWCDEPGLKQDERERRAWLAEGWRTWTLETVMSRDGWFEPLRTMLEANDHARIFNRDATLYHGTQHALPIWRLFHYYRHEGLPIPEPVLSKFDEWAGRLLRLQHDAAAGRLREGEEGLAILRALQLVGERRAPMSLRRLASIEKRRRKASEIADLRRMYGTPWRLIAERFELSEQAAKDLLYEFQPGPRRSARKRGATADHAADLAAAHRRMVKK